MPAASKDLMTVEPALLLISDPFPRLVWYHGTYMSLPTMLHNRTFTLPLTRWAARATFRPTPPIDWLILAGLDVWRCGDWLLAISGPA